MQVAALPGGSLSHEDVATQLVNYERLVALLVDVNRKATEVKDKGPVMAQLESFYASWCSRESARACAGGALGSGGLLLTQAIFLCAS